MKVIKKKTTKKKTVKGTIRKKRNGSKWLVTLKDAPSIVVTASNETEAVTRYREVCRISKTKHTFKAKPITASELADLVYDDNGVVKNNDD